MVGLFAEVPSNILATYTSGGNILFHGDLLLTPVANRVRVLNTKTNKSRILSFETRKNVQRLAVSPDGTLLYAVDIDGHCVVANLISDVEIHKHNFKAPVNAIATSPDGQYVAVTHKFLVEIWKAPGLVPTLAPFELHHRHNTAQQPACLAWSSDSRTLAVGSGALVYVFTMDSEEGDKAILTGHRDHIVTVAFTPDPSGSPSDTEELIYSISRDGALHQWEPAPDGGLNQWSSIGSHFFKHAVDLTSAAVVGTLVVAGFDDGEFRIHEMPDFDNIHTLSMGSGASITASAMLVSQGRADQIALASDRSKQVVVWDWQSENYVVRQGGHQGNPLAVAYNPKGTRVATAGEDGRVIVWDTRTGMSVATFADHTAPVVALAFTPTDALVSVSLDRAMYAYDTTKAKRFRTFDLGEVRPSSLTIDNGGGLLAVGTEDGPILVFNFQTGSLTDTLSQHDARVSGLAFLPDANTMVSGSWDGTVVVWDIFDCQGAVETLKHEHDVTAVDASPIGKEIVAATSDGGLTFWDTESAEPTGFIDGKRDIAGGRSVHDRRTVTTSEQGRYFTTVRYTPDGLHVVAGGDSKWLCVYHRQTRALVKKIQISSNRSLDGVLDFLNSKEMTEVGNRSLFDLDAENAPRMAAKKADRGYEMSSRKTMPSARVIAIAIAPSGTEWVTCTEEGPIVWSQSVSVDFDPLDLSEEITAERCRQLLKQGQVETAVMAAIKLGNVELMKTAVLGVPVDSIKSVSREIAPVYLGRLANVVAWLLESSSAFEKMIRWAESLVFVHGRTMRARSECIEPLRRLQKAVVERTAQLTQVADENRHRLIYLLRAGTEAVGEEEEMDGFDEIEDVLVPIRDEEEEEEESEEELL
ncbi:periodic tryptophan protein [Carpediemonas membranifera]|uniref:Periodic tryptophan protein n=1 Tax=Carpediemonas membranifera TaxID=201153 RepID=A0A8J6AX75_9EUKA|nr:periodic tryptophan protein [Carpediemonas membranifera]|eukprot:KAG9396388.1 periodic tryptophan protein [Carpediemonas membranifera]